MPLVVPVLRLLMVFFNVFETYKTMKPARSSRRGGRAAVRALTNRKRDMKGCLAVWIVWCCLAVYERMFENVVSLLVPFYSEIKSIVLLFFIITRARGAEPIYLHIIRPMIKPYASTIDTLLDLARMFGDIAFIVVTVPIQHALAWWYGIPLEIEEAQEIQEIYEIEPSEDTRSGSPVTRPMRRLEPEIPIAPAAYIDTSALVPQIPSVPFTVHSEMNRSTPSPPQTQESHAHSIPELVTAPVLLAESVVQEPLPITYVKSTCESGVEEPIVPLPQDKGSTPMALTAPEPPTRSTSSTSQTSSGGAPSIASSTSVNTSLPPRVPRNDANKRRTRRGDTKAPASPPKPHEQQMYRYQVKPASKAVSTQPSQEIWLPPASTGETSDAEAMSEQSRVNTSRSGVESAAAETLTVDEWRMYPPFPSAYPPTPLPPAPVRLASHSSKAVSSVPQRPLVQMRSNSDGSSSRTPAAQLEISDAIGKGNSSDGRSTTGTMGGGEDDSSDDGEEMDVDSEDDSEDDFNISLQTPRRHRNANFATDRPHLNSMTSNSSMASSSTKLSTVDRGSRLWTDDTSESESSSFSDESSAVGHKRSSATQGGRESQATIKTSRQVAQAIQLPRQASTTSTSESLDDDKATFSSTSDTKRRRVTALPVRKTVGPPLRLPVNDATIRGRGRGRGQAPIRTASRTGNPNLQAPGLASAHSNSSQTTVGGARPVRGAPATRERTVRGRV